MEEIFIAHIIATGGGLISFLSPCVLPLAPAYLCFVAGISLEDMDLMEKGERAEEAKLRLDVVVSAVFFVLGFSTIFIALGATAAAMNPLILEHKIWLEKVAGGVIILFGLHMMGLLRIGFLNRDIRFNQPSVNLADKQEKQSLMHMGSAYVLGLAFAFGWTPCIGPILATVLTVAAGQDSLGEGVSLLTAYSFGLGLPFIAAALGISKLLHFSRQFRPYLRTLEIVTGGLLAVTGLLIATGLLERLAWALIEYFPVLGNIG
ncbi:MAG: cytochrome c biogenesis protein CcdA [Parvularculales bacterium]